MTSRFAQPQPTRQLEMGLAFVFGCVALAAVLWLAFRAETLNEQQFEILRIVLALAGGGVGAVIPGFLDVGVKAGAKLALRAGGALNPGYSFIGRLKGLAELRGVMQTVEAFREGRVG